MSETDDLALLRSSFTRIDGATTKSAAAATSIGTRIASLMDQIKQNAGNAEAVNQLATEAGAEADKLETLADSLSQMGQDPANPVPVEPPVITPAPTPTPSSGGTDGVPAAGV